MKTLLISLLLFATVNLLGQSVAINFQDWYQNAQTIKEASNFPVIDWNDDIFNPTNEEYVVEVLFNNFSGYTADEIEPIVLQYHFIERYYDSCSKSTCEWYDWMTTYLEYE
ncbi:MAG: hypothetical protein EOL95_11810 [Bacteroidia bacterium]|nr:hypothetical protein [Bacteroidia bacterium]